MASGAAGAKGAAKGSEEAASREQERLLLESLIGGDGDDDDTDHDDDDGDDRDDDNDHDGDDRNDGGDVSPAEAVLRERSNAARQRAFGLWCSPVLQQTREVILREVSSGSLAARAERQLHSDLSLQRAVADTLLQYHPSWLRLALETMTGRRVRFTRASLADGGAAALRAFIARHVLGPDSAIEQRFRDTVKGVFDEEHARAQAAAGLARVLTLVHFLDAAHCQDVMRGAASPRLFRTGGECKSTADVVVALGRDLLARESNPLEHVRRLGVSVTVEQKPVDEADVAVRDFATDLRDGVVLCRFLEALAGLRPLSTGRELPRFPAVTAMNRESNIRAFLALLQRVGLRAPAVATHKAIAAGDVPATVALVWAMVSAFGLPCLAPPEAIGAELAELADGWPAARATMERFAARRGGRSWGAADGSDPGQGVDDEAAAEEDAAAARAMDSSELAAAVLAARQAKAEAEEAARLAQEQAEAEEAARLAQEQAEAEEAARLAQEQAKAEAEEAARLAQEQAEAEAEEAARLAQEQAEAEEAARLAQAAKAEAEEAARLAQAKVEAEEAARLAQAKVEAEAEEAARLAQEQAKAEAEEAARLAQEQAKAEAEEAARLAQAKVEAEEAARLAQAKAEAEAEEAARLAQAKAEAEEAARLAQEQAKAEAEEAARLAQEQAKAEAEEAARLAQEQAKAEAEEAARLTQEQAEAEAEEAARLAQEQAKAEAEEAARLAQEQAEAEEAARLAQEQAKAEAEEAARLAQEQAKAEAEEAARLAQEQAKAEAEEAARLAQEQAKAEAEEAARLAQEQAEAEEAARLAQEQAKAEAEEAAAVLRLAVMLQSLWRGYLARVACQVLLAEIVALQAAVRGYQWRQRLRSLHKRMTTLKRRWALRRAVRALRDEGKLEPAHAAACAAAEPASEPEAAASEPCSPAQSASPFQASSPLCTDVSPLVRRAQAAAAAAQAASARFSPDFERSPSVTPLKDSNAAAASAASSPASEFPTLASPAAPVPDSQQRRLVDAVRTADTFGKGQVAASALGAFAEESERNSVLLARAGAVPALLALLRSCGRTEAHASVMLACLDALCSLVGRRDELTTMALVHAKEAPQVIVGTIEMFRDRRAVAARAVRLLSVLVRTADGRSKLARRPELLSRLSKACSACRKAAKRARGSRVEDAQATARELTELAARLQRQLGGRA
ncbi:hypothetical protein FNF28_01841 [Cafeteria roenbergensis]|uniref:Calponin-homology (CH) domain-containing protein n=1 Tax=Cafeteria roenbergensis TaxID=33653 RepID=A0A5A8DW58_CAFRO|nr:hypothetical protein FNF28_01841 [Cafeteria roenbergensis]